MNKGTVIVLFAVALIADTCFGQLRITCFDVGQGNGALILSPSGTCAVFDAGPTDTTGWKIWGYLRDSCGIRHLDYAFVSHYHADHIGGMDQMIDSAGAPADSFAMGAYDRGFSYSSKAYTNYAAAAGSKRHTTTLGEAFDLGAGVTARCVCINGKTISGDSVIRNSEENNNSQGLLITYGRFRMIFATDIAGYNSGSYKDVETLLAPDIGPVSAMIVNHHGSATSSNPAWVSTLNPKVSVISMGAHNTYLHPKQAAIDRLCNNSSTYIYQTETSPPGAGTIPSGRGRVTNSNIQFIVGDTSFTVNGDHYSLPALGVESAPDAPENRPMAIGAPYPNPSNGAMAIPYDLPRGTNVNVSLYNAAGQLVRHLANGPSYAGRHTVRWDGRDEKGNAASSGVYFCRFEASAFAATIKLVIMR